MTMATAAFSHGMRVYWEDTDAGGIVFYANYLKFFERARTEWLRAAGFEQHALRERTNLIFVVAATSVRYLAPARLDDWLEVTVEPRELGRASMALFQQARRGAQVLAEGEIRIGCVDATSFATRRIPTELTAALQISGPDAKT